MPPLGQPLTDEPLGQRRFGFRDPSGLWVDVVEQTERAGGYWDRNLSGPERTVADWTVSSERPHSFI